MKKVYKKPEVKVYDMIPVHLLCGSSNEYPDTMPIDIVP